MLQLTRLSMCFVFCSSFIRAFRAYHILFIIASRRTQLYQSREPYRSFSRANREKNAPPARFTARRSALLFSIFPEQIFLPWLYAYNCQHRGGIISFCAQRKSGARDSHKIHCICADAMIREAGSAFWHNGSDNGRASGDHAFVETRDGSMEKDIETNNNKAGREEGKGKEKQGASNRQDSRAAADTRLRIMITFD